MCGDKSCTHTSMCFFCAPSRTQWQEDHSDSHRSVNSLLFDVISPVKVPTGKCPSAANTQPVVRVLPGFVLETSDRWSE